MPLNLDYYYGNEAEQYSFYRIPKMLFTDMRFKDISVEAKILYGLLLDRMALSVKNSWMDENGRVYIIFTVAEIMGTLGCAEQKANKLLNELDSKNGVGLIERKRRGLGKPNIIYVKNFIDQVPPPNTQIQKCEKHKSGDAVFTSQEVRKSQTNNTELNKTDFSHTDHSIHHKIQKTNGIDTIDSYRERIKENIDYDIIIQDEPYEKERLDGFVELLAETLCSTRRTIRINQEDMPAETVKSRFLKLNSEHIRYVMDCLTTNTTRVGNVRAYMLSALYNAPSTIKQYYASLVSYDMAHGFGSS